MKVEWKRKSKVLKFCDISSGTVALLAISLLLAEKSMPREIYSTIVGYFIHIVIFLPLLTLGLASISKLLKPQCKTSIKHQEVRKENEFRNICSISGNDCQYDDFRRLSFRQQTHEESFCNFNGIQNMHHCLHMDDQSGDCSICVRRNSSIYIAMHRNIPGTVAEKETFRFRIYKNSKAKAENLSLGNHEPTTPATLAALSEKVMMPIEKFNTTSRNNSKRK